MSFIQKCPICGNKIKEKYSWYDGNIHMNIEYCNECCICDYYEEFFYGNSREGVDGISILYSSYNSYPTEKEYKKHKKKLWSYRKRLLRLHKIKGRYNKL